LNCFINTAVVVALTIASWPIHSACHAQFGLGSPVVFTETTDTGNTISTAIVLGLGVNQVNGSLNIDQDLWGFDLTVGQTIQITSGNSPFDDNLILFDGLGRGIAGNDDIGRASASPGINLPPGISGLDSEIVAFLNPGRYYIAVGQNNISGLSTNGINFINNDSGLFSTPTTEQLASITGSAGTGDYTLTINAPLGIGVPEPTSAILFCLGMLGATTVRRRELI